MDWFYGNSKRVRRNEYKQSPGYIHFHSFSIYCELNSVPKKKLFGCDITWMNRLILIMSCKVITFSEEGIAFELSLKVKNVCIYVAKRIRQCLTDVCEWFHSFHLFFFVSICHLGTIPQLHLTFSTLLFLA